MCQKIPVPSLEMFSLCFKRATDLVFQIHVCLRRGWNHMHCRSLPVSGHRPHRLGSDGRLRGCLLPLVGVDRALPCREYHPGGGSHCFGAGECLRALKDTLCVGWPAALGAFGRLDGSEAGPHPSCLAVADCLPGSVWPDGYGLHSGTPSCSPVSSGEVSCNGGRHSLHSLPNARSV